MKRYHFAELDPRTDLALEARDIIKHRSGREVPGVLLDEKQQDGITITTVQVLTGEAGSTIGKPPGKYITIDCPALAKRNRALQDRVSEVLASELSKMMGLIPGATVLVVGLGNWNATPDALGPKVVGQLLVTRHLKDYVPRELQGGLRPVSALAPGVLGITGIETGDIIRGVVDRLRPDLVIAVDALAARSVRRMMTTIQLADSGIVPGSGVGQKREGLSRETLGVPVIAIGVPTVVHAITIASDTVELLLDQLREKAQFYEMISEMEREDKRKLIHEVLSPEFGELMVTPKEVDVLISDMARIISGTINAALHPNISKEEISLYANM